MIGRVSFFKPEWYGFIAIEGGADFYFSSSSVIGDVELRRGDVVEFWLDDGPRGDLIAVEVRRSPVRPAG